MTSAGRACALALAALACRAPEPERDPELALFAWERGIGVRAAASEPMAMYLWFYEWNLFDAFEPGDFTPGRWDFEPRVAPDGRSAVVEGGDVRLAARVERGGVALELTVRNSTGRDWPELAGLVACFNPGPEAVRNVEMAHHLGTYFLGEGGLERVPDREMRFARGLDRALRERSPELAFAFSPRWNTSAQRANAGILLRESLHGGWTSGVAWRDFVGVQAHNPWLCMHVAARVGPLAAGATKTVRGKLYLFPGDPDEGLRRFRSDLAPLLR